MSGSRKKGKESRIPKVVIVALAVLLLAAGIWTEVADSKRVSTEEVDIVSWFEGNDGLAVIKDYELKYEPVLYEGGSLYVSTDYLYKELNSRFYYDQEEQKLLYTLPEGTKTADISTMADGLPVLIMRNQQAYVYLPYIAQWTDMTWDLYLAPLRLVVHTDFDRKEQATVKQEVMIRQKASQKSPILHRLQAGDSAIVLERGSEWSRVCTEDGFGGYVRSQELGTIIYKTFPHDWYEPVYTDPPKKQKICMVWDQISNWDDNKHLEEYMACTEGVNVVAPTWFRTVDSEGNIDSLSDPSYVEKVHAMGAKVWIVLNNMDNGITNESLTRLLSRTSSRTRLVNTLIEETLAVDADGINVDIEGLPSAAGPGFIQFIRELSVEAHAAGLTVSADNYVPSAWSMHYFRAEQAVMLDYFVIMGYDEHYSGSDAGSTASLGFVRKGVEDTLREVPAERIINGVPFYSRLWKGYGSTLSSSLLSMNAIQRYIRDYELSPIWDAECGQSFAQFSIGGVTARLWVEDADSMTARLNALKEYKLGGLAFWRVGLETESIWETISAYYKS